MNNPTISVVIPAYQANKTITRAIKSVLCIDEMPLEVIVVDDGSSDSTSDVVLGLSHEDGRVRLISQDNGGRAAARNRGILACRGEWIMFLDADDYLLPGAGATIVKTLKTGVSAAMLIFGMVICGDRKLFTAAMPDPQMSLLFYGETELNAGILAKAMIDGTWTSLVSHPGNYEIDTCWARLYRRSLVERLTAALPGEWGPFPVGVKFSEDRLFNMAYLSLVRDSPIVFEATPIYCWDFGESSTAAVIHAADGEGLPIYHERLGGLVEAQLISREDAAAMYGAQAIEQFRRAIVAPINPPSLHDLSRVWSRALASPIARDDLLATPVAYLGNHGVWKGAMRMLSKGHVRTALLAYRFANHLRRFSNIRGKE